ncbi:hypothetical protein ACWFRJ_33485 [Streptomyces sp. NPDC055239]
MPDRATDMRAGVSATFLYENSDARTLVKNAVAESRSRHDRENREERDRIEATWRERALNAEEELGRAQKEILTQCQRIGELMGQIRDFDQMVPSESVQALISEKSTLKHRVDVITQEHCKLQERLESAPPHPAVFRQTHRRSRSPVPRTAAAVTVTPGSDPIRLDREQAASRASRATPRSGATDDPASYLRRSYAMPSFACVLSSSSSMDFAMSSARSGSVAATRSVTLNSV